MSSNGKKVNKLQVDVIENRNDDLEFIKVTKKLKGDESFDTSDPDDYILRKDIEGAFTPDPYTIPFDFDEAPITLLDMTFGTLPSYGANPRIEVWLILDDDSEILYNPGSIVKTKADGVLQTVRFPDIEGGIGFAPSKKGYYLIAK